MDALASLFKTDNIAIILLAIAVIVVWKELKDEIKKTKTDHAILEDKIITMSSELGEMKGKDSVEKSLAVIFGKMDAKLDLILSAKPKPKKDLKS